MVFLQKEVILLKKALIILIILMLPIGVSAYFNTGQQGQGGQIYVHTGQVDDEDIILLVHSELANKSSAKRFEVLIAVIPDNPSLIYKIDVRDSHLAIDNSEETDIVLNEEAIGTQTFGPFLVWASAEPTWGSLIWDILVYSIDGKSVYVSMLMSWGYGVSRPPEIIGSMDDELEPGEEGKTVTPWATATTVGAILFAGRQTYNKAVNKKIKQKDFKVN